MNPVRLLCVTIISNRPARFLLAYQSIKFNQYIRLLKYTLYSDLGL